MYQKHYTVTGKLTKAVYTLKKPDLEGTVYNQGTKTHLTEPEFLTYLKATTRNLDMLKQREVATDDKSMQEHYTEKIKGILKTIPGYDVRMTTINEKVLERKKGRF